MTTTTNWEKEFEYKFGSCAILGSIGRLYSGGFANEARVAEAIDFIRHLLAEQRSELLDQVMSLETIYIGSHPIGIKEGQYVNFEDLLSALRLEGGKK